MTKKTTATATVPATAAVTVQEESFTVSRKDAPEVSEIISDEDLAGHVQQLLITGAEIKTQIGTKPDYKKNKPGSGLLMELDEITAELMQVQVNYGGRVLRSGNVVFVSRMQSGRASLQQDKLRQLLVAELVGVVKKGVDVVAIVNQCFDDATKTGDPFPVRELAIIGEDD